MDREPLTDFRMESETKAEIKTTTVDGDGEASQSRAPMSRFAGSETSVEEEPVSSSL